MNEVDPMSWVDAEMSRLKGEIRLLTRERDSAAERMRIAEQLADSFIVKTTSLGMMRCTFCEHEWVRGITPEHDGDCPVGIVRAAAQPPEEG